MSVCAACVSLCLSRWGSCAVMASLSLKRLYNNLVSSVTSRTAKDSRYTPTSHMTRFQTDMAQFVLLNYIQPSLNFIRYKLLTLSKLMVLRAAQASPKVAFLRVLIINAEASVFEVCMKRIPVPSWIWSRPLDTHSILPFRLLVSGKSWIIFNCCLAPDKLWKIWQPWDSSLFPNAVWNFSPFIYYIVW